MKKLIIVEKPDIARKISRILGIPANGDHFENEEYVLAAMQGHLLTFFEPHDYNPEWKKWRREDLPIIPDEFRWKGVGRRAKAIGELMRRTDVDTLINACDADREGEEIFREVVDHFKIAKPIYRLWLTEHSPESVRNGFRNLKREDDILLGGTVTPRLLAKESRLAKKMDWVWGINLTREMSVLNGSLVSIGPVQTPTLNFIVTRYLANKDFRPETYREVEAEFAEGTAKAKIGKDLASRLDLVGRIGVVRSVSKEHRQEQPPGLFDLTGLQAEANERFGFSASRTLDIAQKLYEESYLSYPRTESHYLPESMRGRMKDWLMRQPESSDIPDPIPERLFDDRKVEAHHAIIPLKEAGEMPADARKLFDLIRQRTVTAFMAPAKFLFVEAVIDVDGLEMRASGRRYEDIGYKKGADDKTCLFEDGMRTKVLSQQIEEKRTKAPEILTEKTLLELMKSAGKHLTDEDLQGMSDFSLGTPATRAAIIDLLIERGYVARDGKKLIPTDRGISLISVVEDALKSPDQRAMTESWLRDVGRGILEPGLVWNKYIDQLKGVLRQERSSIRQGIGACPACGKEIIAHPAFYGCSGYPDCRFSINRSILGVRIEPGDISKLLSGEKIGPYRFTDKQGEKFSSLLRLTEDRKIRFERPAGLAIACPKCGSTLTDGGRRLSCSCGFVFWRQIAGYQLKDVEIKKLFKGKAGPFHFTSKSGKRFDAELVWNSDEGRATFLFPDRDRKTMRANVAK